MRLQAQTDAIETRSENLSPETQVSTFFSSVSIRLQVVMASIRFVEPSNHRSLPVKAI